MREPKRARLTQERELVRPRISVVPIRVRIAAEMVGTRFGGSNILDDEGNPCSRSSVSASFAPASLFPGLGPIDFHIVRTTRNCALPLSMRAYASPAFSSGYVSIIGRTPVSSAKFSVSSSSAAVPAAVP